jgi:hypothetical protein
MLRCTNGKVSAARVTASTATNGYVSAFLSSMFSIRRSGMSHSRAANTYRPKEIHCHQKAKGMAAAYSTCGQLAFPIALLQYRVCDRSHQKHHTI